MATNTTNFSLSKPAVNSATDEDLWGDLLNTNMDTIDGLVKQARDIVSLSKTTTYTTVDDDRNKMIEADATAGAFTITLLSAATAGDGSVQIIKKIDSSSNAVTIDADGTETIDGGLTKSLATQYDTIFIRSNGTNWLIVAQTESSAVPSGTVIDFAGTSAPTGYLDCDGTAVSRTTYAVLFAILSTTWGVGDGSTTFNLPNLERSVTVGSGGTGTSTLANSVGSTGGAETHALTTAELAPHSHGISLGAATGGSGRSAASTAGETGTTTTGSAGSGTAHNIMQPSAVVMKVIKT